MAPQSGQSSSTSTLAGENVRFWFWPKQRMPFEVASTKDVQCRCRLHGGARGSGASPGERTGNAITASGAAIAERLKRRMASEA
jgi:hypothetical protein